MTSTHRAVVSTIAVLAVALLLPGIITADKLPLPPEITNPPEMLVFGHCDMAVYDFEAEDPEGDDYWFELLNGPGTMDAISGIWSYQPSIEDCGYDHMLEVRACDETGCGTVVQTTLIFTDEPPIFIDGCDMTITAYPGYVTTHTVVAIDPDPCDQIMYFLVYVEPDPIGLYMLDEFTGQFLFDPDPEDIGPFEVLIEAADGFFVAPCTFFIEMYSPEPLPFVSIAQVFSPKEPTIPATSWGRLEIDLNQFRNHYGGELYFLNMFTSAGWVVANMTIFPNKDGARIAKYFDIGVDPGYPVEMLDAYIQIDDAAQFGFDPGPVAAYEVGGIMIESGGIGDAGRYYVPEENPPRPSTNFDPDSAFKYWVLPVDSATENVQAEKNQCVPAGIANSLQFLANNYGEVFKPPYANTPGVNGDSCLVGQLGQAMGYTESESTYLGNMLNGKLNCLNQWGMGDRLVHRTQGTGFHPGHTNLPESLYTSGQIHNDSENGRVTFDWLYRQIKKGENVELVFSYEDTLQAHDGSDSIVVTRAHMVRIYGAGSVHGRLRLRVLHDGVQRPRDTNNDQGLDFVELEVQVRASDSAVILDGDGTDTKPLTVNFALSESPKEHYAPPPNTFPWHNEDGADNTGAEDSGDANGLTGTEWRPLDEPEQGTARWGGTVVLPGDEGPPPLTPPPPIDRPARRDPRTPTPVNPPWTIPERITLTITIVPTTKADTIYLDHLGVNPYAKPLAQVVPSFWHEVVPDRGMEWEVTEWDDIDNDGFLSAGDRIAGIRETSSKAQIPFEFFPDLISMDVWVEEIVDSLPTFYFTCDWYKDQFTDLANYSVPDFDQKQLNWYDSDFDWNRCGPAAVANALWWIDSKMEPAPVDPHPFGVTPPNDNYRLLEAYGLWDDHDTMNVQPFISDLATRMATGVTKGTYLDSLIEGVRSFIADAGLEDDYTDTLYRFPHLYQIEDELMDDHDVILRLMIYERPDGSYSWVPIGAHYVTVAGFCSVMPQICISDPWIDYLEGEPPAGSVHGPTVHNDADTISGPHGQIQHDQYGVWSQIMPGVSPDPVALIDYPIGYEELVNFEGMNTAAWSPYLDGRVLMVINEAYVIRDTSSSCCRPPIRGDINDDELMQPDIADLVYMVTYMFQNGPAPPCDEPYDPDCPDQYYTEADINGDGTCTPDIVDLIHLVTYMFQNGPLPAPCP